MLVSACFALAENNEEPRAFGIFPRTIIQPYKLNTSSLIQSNALILGTFTILLGYLQGLGMCMHIILNYIMYILYIYYFYLWLTYHGTDMAYHATISDAPGNEEGDIRCWAQSPHRNDEAETRAQVMFLLFFVKNCE